RRAYAPASSKRGLDRNVDEAPTLARKPGLPGGRVDLSAPATEYRQPDNETLDRSCANPCEHSGRIDTQNGRQQADSGDRPNDNANDHTSRTSSGVRVQCPHNRSTQQPGQKVGCHGPQRAEVMLSYLELS